MGWLSGWSKRVKLTTDQLDIDADLANFPILLYLSSSSGRLADDITFIFTQLGANKLKIAVTTSDGITECYVEVEKWDYTGTPSTSKAWLWVKAPSVSGTVDTDLYLYYDNTHADNTAYVGDPESTPAMNVWDANFKMVQHLRDKTTSTTADSSTNNNDGTKTSANNPIVTTAGKISDAQDFSTDGINHPNIQPASITLEAWIKTNTQPANGWIVMSCLQTNGRYGYLFGVPWGRTVNKVYITRVSDLGGYTDCGSTSTLSNAVWYHIVGTYDGTNLKIYVNGALENTVASAALVYGTMYSYIGRDAETGYELYYDGVIDEARTSDTVRNLPWIKASYETGRDHLLDWGTEETSAATYTKTFTSDAHLLNRQPKTFTSDARLLKRLSKAFTADALATYRKTKTFSTDANLLKRQLKTFTTDARLLKRLTKTFTSDAILEAVGMKGISTDALLLKRIGKNFTVDARLVKRAIKVFTADAILEAAGFKAIDTDAILLKRQAKQFTADGRLLKRFPKVFSADAYLETATTKGFTVDGVLLKHQTVTFAADAYLTSPTLPVVSIVGARMSSPSRKRLVYADVASLMGGALTLMITRKRKRMKENDARDENG
jgi:hypothetical protein